MKSLSRSRMLALGVFAAGLLGLASAAQARTNVFLSIGVPIAPAPVYVAPQPVYVQPEPVYIAPQPVYVQPRPVYYAPAAVYVAPGYGYGRWHRHHRHHRRWDY